MSTVSYSTRHNKGRLADLDGKPLSGKAILIRAARQREFEAASGPYRMWVRGELVREVKTDGKGAFSFKGLKPGDYWFTFMDPEQGESFLVTIEPGHERGTMELSPDSWVGSLCSVMDVERNMWKPSAGGKIFCENEQPCERANSN